VRTLDLPPIAFDATSAWKDFFATYNRTPVGDRVAEIVASGDAVQGTVDLVGLGDAGPWCLLARAVAPRVFKGATACDMADLAIDDDKVVVERLYAPGLRRAGDVATAAWLCADTKLALFRVGDRGLWERLRLPGDVRIESGAWSPEGIADHIAG
ncbi:MAG: hypothetical protein ACKO5K_08440, partial [Armatimonadota bacterium]